MRPSLAAAAAAASALGRCIGQTPEHAHGQPAGLMGCQTCILVIIESDDSNLRSILAGCSILMHQRRLDPMPSIAAMALQASTLSRMHHHLLHKSRHLALSSPSGCIEVRKYVAAASHKIRKPDFATTMPPDRPQALLRQLCRQPSCSCASIVLPMWASLQVPQLPPAGKMVPAAGGPQPATRQTWPKMDESALLRCREAGGRRPDT